MATSSAENTVRFGLFELDLRTRQLARNGAKIRLPQQPIQVLALLLEHPGEVVTREELRQRLWPSDVFVDFDHGLNKSIQKLREALDDSAGSPRYIETIPRVGYRFIAPVSGPGKILEFESGVKKPQSENVSAAQIGERRRAQWFLPAAWIAGAGLCVAVAFGGMVLYRSRHRPLQVRYTQLTDFTDSAVAPALSPDGHMVAFIRGSDGFLTSDQIYVKMLPNGEARRVTDDNRAKYGLTFSPDGSEIAYTVLDGSGFSTYEVSALGGEPQLLLKNAAGLVWLDPQQLLFSRVRSGIHMGVVTAAVTGAGLREIYFPAHERAMAHESFPSADRRWALVVEMNENGDWSQCRLVALENQSPPRSVGPAGACTSAGWSPDGRWMYFTAAVEGQSHVWRQRFPDGEAEQLTFGPTEEDRLTVEPDGRSLITSVGVHESAIWIHDGSGERPLSSEGEVASPPRFSPDASILYYLLRRGEGSGTELWRTTVDSGKSEVVFPEIAMTAFDLSPDGKQVVYTTAASDGTTQLWLAPVDRSSSPTRVRVTGAHAPHFGGQGQIIFQDTVGNTNYLEQINSDGSRRSRVLPYPILGLQSISPGRRWVTVGVPGTTANSLAAIMMIPLNGGVPQRICATFCIPQWSTDGRFLFVQVAEASQSGPGRSLAIPIGTGESLPKLPSGGIPPLAKPNIIPGAESVDRADLTPGKDPDHYAWVNTTVHRNLYQISLP